jgi:glyoxylase-like metal-dependent hydrolase (beta-lactamase superfamily II)
MGQHIEALFDPQTSTITYVVFDATTRDAIVIDPVLDYDPLASQTSTASAEAVIALVKDQRLVVRWLLETHVHADHLSGASLLKRRLEAPVAIGEKITVVQKTFKKLFDLPDDFATDGSQFDRLLRDGEMVEAGSLRIEAMATPGHTPACMSYKIGDAVFTGDALFMHDYGTGRCDFPNGSADDLYTSVHERLYRLPDDTRVFVGHDYQPGGRAPSWETTIGASKANNPQLRAETSRREFVKFRNERDASLKAPRLLYQSVQTNVDAGRLPRAHVSGIRYFRLPLNAFGPTDDHGEPL